VAAGGTLHPIFSLDNRFLIAVGPDAVLRWPLEYVAETRAPVRIGRTETVIELPGADFQRACLSYDNATLAVVGHQRNLLVSMQQSSHPIEFAHGQRNSCVTLSPDGHWVAAASYYGLGVTVWDAHDGRLAYHLITNENATVSFNPKSGILVTATTQECVWWDPQSWTPRMRRRLDIGGDVPAVVSFSPKGGFLALVSNRDQIELLEPETGRDLATLTSPLPETLGTLAFSGDERYLAAETVSKLVHLWDLRALRRELASMNLDW